MIQGVSRICLFQVITPNYSNKILLAVACLFITNSSEIQSIKSVIKFRKILIKLLLEKSFYLVEEFMTADS
jgi:hypothetical protein